MDSVSAAVPRDTAICGHPGCRRQRKGEANAPHGRRSFSGSGAVTGPGEGTPELALQPGSSPCPSETLPSAPHPQDGRRRDLSQPISSLAEQRLYPPLPWQPAFSSGSFTRGTEMTGRAGLEELGEAWEPPSRLLGPMAGGPGEEETLDEITGRVWRLAI